MTPSPPRIPSSPAPSPAPSPAQPPAPSPSYSHGTSTTPLLGDTIGANLDRAIAAYPDREALVDVPSGRRWTCAEFGAAIDEVARGLPAKRITTGDRVGIWAVNCPEWALTQYATARIGAIMVNINPAHRAHELEYVLRQAGVAVLIASLAHQGSDYQVLVDQVRGRCPELREAVYIGDPSRDALTEAAATVPHERLAAVAAGLSCDDPVNIQYTSGTTGFPEGATLSHHKRARTCEQAAHPHPDRSSARTPRCARPSMRGCVHTEPYAGSPVKRS
ncbi:AMP-binding protein [Streptomyces sp. NPDC058625]|uniref:AMP-binding protein n=1 Tax=Streptomyces sp. NPDC058625 TaxID=3346564 RepID=UPI00364DF897